MKKTKTKKIIASVALVASAVMSLGCMASLIGCKTGKNNTTEPSGLGNGKTYYVSTDGKYDNDGSKKKPFNIVTLLNSEDILKPGDTVLVQPGVYKIATLNRSEKIMLKVSGEYNNYISIMNADPTKQCVLDFSAQDFASTNRGVEIYGSYIYWNGIDVCGAGDNGLYIGGSYNTVEDCEFYNNRDTGLQLGRSYSEYTSIDMWPSYNLVKNCTSHNNYDNETYGENADGFAAKLTVGYGNVFDGCIAYRNSDDGWDLYAKTESGNIGTVIMYNCVAYENGYLEYTQAENNARFPTWRSIFDEANTNSYLTRDGDGNGFKLGGSVMEGDVLMYNCLSFNNRMHGITDNSNPGVISVNYCTSYNNSAAVDNNPSSDTFGYIVDKSNSDTHANIDLARQNWSYNNVNHVLSVKDAMAKSLEADAYRGSVIDSMFIDTANKKDVSNKVEGAIDAATNTGGEKGETADFLDSTKVFSTIPFSKDNGAYTFNITGTRDLYANRAVDGKLNPNRAHIIFRNEDGSINMGSMLAIKDYSILLGNDNKIGSELNLGSYEEYKHFFARDIVDQQAASEDAAIVARAKETLTLSCDPGALYQDFDLPTKMNDVTITWESDDDTLLYVNDENINVDQFSGASYIRGIVYRPLDVDKEVTLTATITSGKVSDTKEFTLKVKQGTPKIGTIIATTADGTSITDGGVIIVDKGSDFTLPEIIVENGIDYNHKLLSSELYTLKTDVEWRESSDKEASLPIPFNINNPGVYTVTETVTMKSDKTQKQKMSFTIYVADADAEVDFSGKANVTVNLNGYTIAGKMKNATGKLFAMSSAEKLTLTVDDLISETSQYVIDKKVKSYDFRGERISFNFENENKAEYYIYYVVTNMNGTASVESVYEQKISVVEISNTADFMKVAGGGLLTEGEVPTSTIYSLTQDLDFAGIKWTVGSAAFKGVLNGMGHTVSNITVSGAENTGVFYKVNGGTIMNIKFVNTNISSTGQKVGLVSECNGGYFYNIQLIGHNVSSSNQRVGGLIGFVMQDTDVNNINAYVFIEQVAVDNSDEKYADYMITGQQRTGGIIGFSQATKTVNGSISIEIRNCLVNAYVRADFELGGIFGTYDCGNNPGTEYDLKISYCAFNGKVEATGNKTFASGILGYQKGSFAQMNVSNCVSVGKIYFNNAQVEASLKNCSGIIGSSTSLAVGYTSNVKNCYAVMEEFNTNFEVIALSRFAVILARNYTEGAGLDVENRWTLIYDEEEDDTTYVQAPYVTLNFLGNWD